MTHNTQSNTGGAEAKMSSEIKKEDLEYLLNRIRPTSDTGSVLGKRVKKMQSLITDKCGAFGSILAKHWPQGECETHAVIPLYMSDEDKIDAVINISVCLYDDLEYLKKLTKNDK